MQQVCLASNLDLFKTGHLDFTLLRSIAYGQSEFRWQSLEENCMIEGIMIRFCWLETKNR